MTSKKTGERFVIKEGKKKREESHWEGEKIKKEEKGNKQRKSRPLKSQERKSKRAKLFAQIVQLRHLFEITAAILQILECITTGYNKVLPLKSSNI